MVTLKSFRQPVRAKRKFPTPKRKPARLIVEVAAFRGRNIRKPKSR